MMTVKELKERKKELGFSNKMISELSGVPLSTVEKIFGGTTESPRFGTLHKIEEALYSKGAEMLSHPSDYLNVDFNDFRTGVSEAPGEYAAGSFYGYDEDLALGNRKQGQYTIEDCRRLPEGLRMELIDGVLYDMAAPTPVHQMIVAQVNARIEAVLDSSDGDCVLFIAPLDVQFSEDNIRDCLEPDLLIVCDKQKYTKNHERIIGAPDMVMEVISPSTRGRDRVLKLNKYLENGVREYWIVDPEIMEIHVYYSENGISFSKYTFDDVVPVRIFDGKVSVNFAAITRKLRDRLGFGSVK